MKAAAVLATIVALFAATVPSAGNSAAEASDPSFAPALLPGTRGACNATTGDLNGDGALDLVVGNCASNAIEILLQDKTGGFDPAPGGPIKFAKTPASIAAADFNRDRKLDLAVAKNESADIAVLLGDGTGAFTAAPGSPLKVPGLDRRVTTAELTGDGNVDLVVTAYRNRKWNATALLGDGSGRFAAASGSPTVLGGRAGLETIVVADFNRDRKPDLAAANSESQGISILFGNGQGRFRATTSIKNRLPGSLAVADLNRDSKLDLAAASNYSGRVTIFLGNGRGGFRPAPGSPIVIPGYPHRLAAADLNGDRRPDLAVAGGGVAILLGKGAGRFRTAAFSPFATPDSELISAVADLNGDRKPDLLTVGLRGITIVFQASSSPGVGRGRTLGGRGAVFSTRTAITMLAADGNRAAAVTAKVKRVCSRIVVWTAPGRKARSFKPDCSGDGVSAVALGAGQVAWIFETGGNNLELYLMAAKLSGGKAKQIDYEVNGDRAGGDPAGGWVGHLLGGDGLLAYNNWAAVCDREEGWVCGEEDPQLRITDQTLVRIAAGRRVVTRRGSDSYPLSAVGGGRMAVDSGGTIVVLEADGTRVSTVPAERIAPRAVALSKTQLAVQRTFTLDLYDPATGEQGKSIQLGAAAAFELAGVNSKVALLRGSRRVALVRLTDGKLISLPLRSTSYVDAKLTSAGLFYAYNVRRGAKKGRIVFEPTGRLLRRF
jgi:hypothetical protein